MPKSDLSLDRCEEILEQEEIGYLSMCLEGQPYCLPFNFLYEQGRIYIHTGLKGLKWQHIAGNPRVCFTVAVPGRKITGESPCRYTYQFESVVAYGVAVEIDSTGELQEALGRLIDKYRTAPVLPVPEEKLARLRMLRVDIKEITGRKNS